MRKVELYRTLGLICMVCLGAKSRSFATISAGSRILGNVGPKRGLTRLGVEGNFNSLSSCIGKSRGRKVSPSSIPPVCHTHLKEKINSFF